VTRPLTEREVADDYEGFTGRVIVERFAALDPVAMPAVLVAGHGPFAWGATVAKSLENAAALEAVAKWPWAPGTLNHAPRNWSRGCWRNIINANTARQRITGRSSFNATGLPGGYLRSSLQERSAKIFLFPISQRRQRRRWEMGKGYEGLKRMWQRT